jgi:hypothetical protein
MKPRFQEVGIDYCTRHSGLRYISENRCDYARKASDPCQFLPLGFIKGGVDLAGGQQERQKGH